MNKREHLISLLSKLLADARFTAVIVESFVQNVFFVDSTLIVQLTAHSARSDSLFNFKLSIGERGLKTNVILKILY